MDANTAHVVVAAITCGSVIIVGVTAIATRAWQRVVSIQSEASRAGNSETVEAIAQLRGELHALRDTATRYDMAFDTALQRIESRVSHLEGQALADLPNEGLRISVKG